MKNKMKRKITSEFVGFGHPDKVADQISDAILDEYLKRDPNTRAGIEVMIKDNIVVLGGEVNSKAAIDYDSTVRKVISNIPYPEEHNLSASNIKIINLIGKQSPEISNGIEKEDGIVGAGDQGFTVGFASNETEDYLPLGVYVAKKICKYIEKQTKKGLGPDCKSQVIMEYEDNGKARIDSILVSSMHKGCLETDRLQIISMIENNEIGLSNNIFEKYIKKGNFLIKVNPCGEWRIGGSVSDCGMTGRKIVVDQYGGYAPVGGGSISGKCMSKIDRSAAYLCRYIAKNIVAAGLSDNAKVELSYIIGEPQPSSINIEMNTNKELEEEITKWIVSHIDLSPSGIIKRFDGSYPRYYYTARNGHFGISNNEIENENIKKIYPWEVTDLAEILKLSIKNN